MIRISIRVPLIRFSPLKRGCMDIYKLYIYIIARCYLNNSVICCSYCCSTLDPRGLLLCNVLKIAK